MHGGSAPQVRRKAQMRLANQEAKEALRRLDIAPIGDPVAELLAVAAEVVAVKDFLAGRMAEADREHEATLVRVYGEALDRASRLLVEINRLGLLERQTRLAEEEAQLIADVIWKTLNDLGIKQTHEVIDVVGKHLLSLGELTG